MNNTVEKRELISVTKDDKVDVTYIYNGTAVKVKGVNIFKRLKPKAKTEVIVNTQS